MAEDNQAQKKNSSEKAREFFTIYGLRIRKWIGVLLGLAVVGGVGLFVFQGTFAQTFGGGDPNANLLQGQNTTYGDALFGSDKTPGQEPTSRTGDWALDDARVSDDFNSDTPPVTLKTGYIEPDTGPNTGIGNTLWDGDPETSWSVFKDFNSTDESEDQLFEVLDMQLQEDHDLSQITFYAGDCKNPNCYSGDPDWQYRFELQGATPQNPEDLQTIISGFRLGPDQISSRTDLSNATNIQYLKLYAEPIKWVESGGERHVMLREFIVEGEESKGSVNIEPTSGLETSEGGDNASFNVSLSREPSSEVNVPMETSDSTEGLMLSSDGSTTSARTLTFTADNWDQPQTVEVVGVDDSEVDGDQSYQIITNPTSSMDATFDGLDPEDVSLTNLDDDTSDGGDGGDDPSPSPVEIDLDWRDSITDPWVEEGPIEIRNGSSGQVSARLDNENHSHPHLFHWEVTGSTVKLREGNENRDEIFHQVGDQFGNDNHIDSVDIRGVDTGSENLALRTTVYELPEGWIRSDGQPSSELQEGQQGIASNILPTGNSHVVVNGNTETTEGGNGQLLGVSLDAQPDSTVTVDISSGDETEATVDPEQLNFTSDNFDQAQDVSLLPQEDEYYDGEQHYDIEFVSSSDDPEFNNTKSVDAVNFDNEPSLESLEVTPVPPDSMASGSSQEFEMVPRDAAGNDLSQELPNEEEKTDSDANWLRYSWSADLGDVSPAGNSVSTYTAPSFSGDTDTLTATAEVIVDEGDESGPQAEQTALRDFDISITESLSGLIASVKMIPPPEPTPIEGRQGDRFLFHAQPEDSSGEVIDLREDMVFQWSTDGNIANLIDPESGESQADTFEGPSVILELTGNADLHNDAFTLTVMSDSGETLATDTEDIRIFPSD